MLTRLVDKDDSGGLTDGTPHDNTWLQKLNDTIDARWTLKVVTQTGTVNDLDISEADRVTFNLSGPLTITGILAPSAPSKVGKVVWFRNGSNYLVTFAHQNAGSAAVNRIWNAATSAPTPIAFNGSAAFVYIGSGWAQVHHEQGAWITPPYSAANFSGTGGTWTVEAGDVLDLRYRLVGATLTVAFTLQSTSVGSGVTSLLISPGAYGGFAAVGTINNLLFTAGGAASLVQVVSTGMVLFMPTIGAAWPVTTNGTTVYGQITFPVT